MAYYDGLPRKTPELSYILLFLFSFASATVLPFSSEAFLFGLIHAGYTPCLLLFAAGTGNTLGAGVNYVLGRCVLRYQHKAWFYLKPARLARFESLFQRYGVACLLCSWVPLIGDAFTFFAGVARVHWAWFFILVGLGKFMRYAAVLYLAV